MSATVSTQVPFTLVVTILPNVTDVTIAGQSVLNNGTIHATLPSADAGAVIGPVVVKLSDGSAFTGRLTVINADGSSTSAFTVDSAGELVVGSANVAAGSYPLKLSVTL